MLILLHARNILLFTFTVLILKLTKLWWCYV